MPVSNIHCGYCKRDVSALILAGILPTESQAAADAHANERTYWLQCPNCYQGSVKTPGGKVFPPGPATTIYPDLPEDVAAAWWEAGVAHAMGAYTAAEMMCRKILMHIAVDKTGAAVGLKFAEYVDALEAAHLFAAGLKPVVDSVRTRGNAANHELPASTEENSLQTIRITDHLLQVAYVLPLLAKP